MQGRIIGLFSTNIIMQALTAPGVFTSGHFIPYIFMEWDFIISAHKAAHCDNIETVVSLLQASGYSALNIDPLGVLQDKCLQMKYDNIRDVVWVHRTANPLWDKEINYINCVVQYQ